MQRAWTGGRDAWALDKDSTGYRIWGADRHVVLFRSPTQSWHGVDAGVVPYLNTWYHLAGVYDADAMKIKLYRNGVLVAEAASPERLKFSTYPTNLRLARHSVAARFYPIIIDEVRIYNRALSSYEISEIYTKGTFIKDGLVLYLPFHEGEGNIAHDVSGYGNHGTIYGAQWVVKKALRVLPKAR